MKWPWSRARKELRGKPSDEATEAAAQAQRALRDMENLACRADEVADRLSATRERNHFAAAVIAAIRGA